MDLSRLPPLVRLPSGGRHRSLKVVETPDGRWVVGVSADDDAYAPSMLARLRREGTLVEGPGWYAVPFEPPRLGSLRVRPALDLVRSHHFPLDGSETPLSAWYARQRPVVARLPYPWPERIDAAAARLARTSAVSLHGDLRETHLRARLVHPLSVAGPPGLDVAGLLGYFPHRPLPELLAETGLDDRLGRDAALVQIGLAWGRRAARGAAHHPTPLYAGWMLELAGARVDRSSRGR